MEIITSVVLVTIVIILVTFCLNNKFMVSGNSLPGPIAWPFFGNILMVSRSKNFYQLTKSLQEKYGNVYRLKLGQLTVVCISGHKNLSRILVEDGENSSQRPNWMFCSKKVFKEKGIVWANGHQWKELNKLILQSQQTETFQQNMQQELTQEVNELCKCFSPDNATDPLDCFYDSTLNVLSIMVFGKRFQYNDLELNTLRSSIKYIFKNGQSLGRKETFFSWLALFTKSQVNEVVGEIDKLHGFMKQKLENHAMENNKKLPHDLLAAYLNPSESERKDRALSEENVFQAIVDMYIAAYDTYTATMIMIVFYLLKYPDVQRRCREEIHKVCKGKRPITIDDKDKLCYVESTIKEVLRIAKPVVLAIYRTIERSITVEGYNIPAKSIILFDLNDPQIDPTLWDNPDVFDPDRWTNPHKNGYIPFGLGPRRCVGAPTIDLTLFLMITNILQKFELVPEDEKNLPMEKEWSGIALFPKPFKMFMKPVDY
ncbi:cytochrome P450 2J4-like [Mytilus edulis]|uniref:cytochrome P450 2J4-like n=1 Tax=Mytilus edulis TaxID=6550 RepID=UPI0039F0E3A3